VDEASTEMIGKKVSTMGLTKQMLAEAKDPAKNIERRNILGGPAKATVRKKIATEKKRLTSDENKLASLQDQVKKSYDELAAAASGITGKRK
jgi:argininosuccinate lyase